MKDNHYKTTIYVMMWTALERYEHRNMLVFYQKNDCDFMYYNALGQEEIDPVI